MWPAPAQPGAALNSRPEAGVWGGAPTQPGPWASLGSSVRVQELDTGSQAQEQTRQAQGPLHGPGARPCWPELRGHRRGLPAAAPPKCSIRGRRGGHRACDFRGSRGAWGPGGEVGEGSMWDVFSATRGLYYVAWAERGIRLGEVQGRRGDPSRCGVSWQRREATVPLREAEQARPPQGAQHGWGHTQRLRQPCHVTSRRMRPGRRGCGCRCWRLRPRT